MKRVLAWILCIVMLFGTVPFSALATDGEPLPSPSPSPSAQPETVDESSPSPSAQAEELQPELLTQQSNNAADIAAALAADGYYESEGDVTLDADLTIPAGARLKVYGSLTVPSGVTLTVLGTLEIAWGSGVTVSGHLVQKNSEQGGVQIYGTLTIYGTYDIDSLFFIGNKPAGSGSIGGIISWSDTYVTKTVYSQYELLEALESPYGHCDLIIAGDITLTEDVVFPENYAVSILSYCSLTVAEGARLENKTNIRIEDGGHLTINGAIANTGVIDAAAADGFVINGTPEDPSAPPQSGISADIAAALAADGFYALEGDVTLDKDLTIPSGTILAVSGSLTVPAGVTITVLGSLGINTGGSVVVNGSLVDQSTSIGVQVYGSLTVNGSYSTDFYIHMGDSDGISIEGVLDSDIYWSTHIYDEDDFSAALSSPYGRVWLGIMDDVMITGEVVLPANANLQVMEGCTLTVAEGARLENNLNIYINEGAQLIVNGTLTDNGVIEQATEGSLIINGLMETEGSSYTQEEFAAWIEENCGSDSSYVYELDKDVTISSNFTIPGYASIYLGEDVTLKVENGATLTLKGSLYLLSDSTVYVAAGGTFSNQGYFLAETGTVTFEDGATLRGSYLQANSSVTVSSNIYNKTLLEYIFTSDVTLDAIQAAFANIGTYARVTVQLTEDFDITGDLTIPYGGLLFIYGNWDSTLQAPVPVTVTIKADAAVTNYGEIDVAGGSTLVIEEGALLDNTDGTVTKGYDNSGNIVGSIITRPEDNVSAFTQEEFVAWMEENCGGEMLSFLPKSVTITSDLTIPQNVSFVLDEGITFTVASGVRLTVLGQIYMWSDATFLAASGSWVTNGGYMSFEDGTVTFEDGAILAGYHIYASPNTNLSSNLISQTVINVLFDNTVSMQDLKDAFTYVDNHPQVNVQIAVDFDITGELTIPYGACLDICGVWRGNGIVPNTVTLKSGAVLTNRGSIDVSDGSTLIIEEGAVLDNADGTVSKGYDNSGHVIGTITGPGVSDNRYSENAADLEEMLSILESGGIAGLVGSATLEENLTITENSYLVIYPGASLTVPAGVTLTVNGSISVLEGGSLKVNKNGVLQNNGYVASEGSLTVATGGKYQGSGELQVLHGSTVKGIGKSQISLLYMAGSEADIRNALGLSGYTRVFIALEMADVTLGKDLTLPENCGLIIAEGAALTVPEGVTLANYGELGVSAGGSLIVLDGGTLANYGNFATDSGAFYENYGLELGHGSNEVHVLQESELNAVLAAAENYQHLVVYMGRSFSINGETTLPGNVELQLGGSTLTIRSGAVFTNNGEIYGLPGCIDIRDGGELVNSGSITDADIIANGTYTDNGYLQLRLDNIRTNIPGEDIHFYDEFTSMAELSNMLAVLGEAEYSDASLWSYIVGEDATDKALYIPENTSVTICTNGEVIRLQTGGGITNAGALTIGDSGKLIVEEGAYLRSVNSGRFDIGYPGLDVYGEFEPGINCNYYASPRTQAELIDALGKENISIFITDCSITLSKDVTVPEGTHLEVDWDGSLTVKSGCTLTNNGSITVGDSGSVKISGKFVGQRMLQTLDGRITAPMGSYATMGRQVERIVIDDVPGVAGHEIQLTAQVYPQDAENIDVEWSVVSGDAEIDPQSGLFYGSEPGSVVVRATSVENSGIYTEKALELQNYGIAVSQNGTLIESGEALFAVSGQQLKLDAALVPANLSGTKIVWEILPGSEEYLSLSQKNGTATFTAKYISSPIVAEIRVRSADNLLSNVYSVNIAPAVEKVIVSTLSGETGSVVYDLNAEENLSSGLQLSLCAEVLPADAVPGSISWSSSNRKIATVDNSGLVTFTGTAGTVKITAQATNSKIKGIITISAKKLIQSIEIRGESRLLSGKSATFTVWDVSGEKAVKLKNSQVIWSIADSYSPLSISTSGKLSTKAINEPLYTSVSCHLKDNEDAVATFPIEVYPAAQTVYVSDISLCNPVYWNNSTYYLDIRHMTEADLTLAELAAELAPYSSMQDVVWTSSSKNVTLSVDEESGNVTVNAVWDSKKNLPKTGTYTITAKAADGSGVKGSITLCVGIFCDTLAVEQHDMELLSKTTTYLCNKGIAYLGEQAITPTNAAITWELMNPADSAYVTLTASGKLTAKTVYTRHDVHLMAYAKDTGREVAYLCVTIMPSSLGQLAIVEDIDQRLPLTGSTRIMPLGSTLQIYASRLTNTGSALEDVIETEGISFKSSNTSIAGIDSSGLITANKAGTATITVTDSNRKTATMKVKVEVPAATLSITDSKGKVLVNDEGSQLSPIYLAAGKSISFKALVGPSSATNKTAAWTLLPGSSGTMKGSKYTAPAAVTTPVIANILVKVGELAQYIDVYVTPATKSIQLLHDLELVKGVPQVDVSRRTTVQLQSLVTPQSNISIPLDWSSSNTKIATVDTEGNVTFTGSATGKVKITARATDGSGKSASITINAVCSPLSAEANYSQINLAGGKKATLKLVKFYPEVTSLKNVTWTLASESAYASLSSKGVLTTKAVTAPESVTAVAYNVYGEEVASITVNIYPATKSIAIVHDFAFIKKNTVQINLTDSNTASLSTSITPMYACDVLDWSSSNQRIATVDDWGNVEFLKTGTVTITAKTTDGTGKKAALKFVVVQKP